MHEDTVTPDGLLRLRLDRGWRPTPSYLVQGLTVLGHAAEVPRALWTTPNDAAR